MLIINIINVIEQVEMPRRNGRQRNVPLSKRLWHVPPLKTCSLISLGLDENFADYFSGWVTASPETLKLSQSICRLPTHFIELELMIIICEVI